MIVKKTKLKNQGIGNSSIWTSFPSEASSWPYLLKKKKKKKKQKNFLPINSFRLHACHNLLPWECWVQQLSDLPLTAVEWGGDSASPGRNENWQFCVLFLKSRLLKAPSKSHFLGLLLLRGTSLSSVATQTCCMLSFFCFRLRLERKAGGSEEGSEWPGDGLLDITPLRFFLDRHESAADGGRCPRPSGASCRHRRPWGSLAPGGQQQKAAACSVTR